MDKCAIECGNLCASKEIAYIKEPVVIWAWAEPCPWAIVGAAFPWVETNEIVVVVTDPDAGACDELDPVPEK